MRYTFLALMLAAGCGTIQPSNKRPVVEPPAEFVFEPAGPVVEIPVKSDVVPAVCSALADYYGILRDPRPETLNGCTLRPNAVPGVCIVVRDEAIPAIRRHEIAHCNGWVHG